MDSLSALKCTVAYNRYGGYCVPLSALHRPSVKTVRAGEVYEPDTVAFMTAHADQGDIVHAGTFFGDFLPALASGLGPDSVVWAYEPNPESWRCARITLELNDIHNVRLVNAGLGSDKGVGAVEITDDDGLPLGGGSRISDRDPDNDQVRSVDIVSIDDTVPNNRDVGILQLDVEGHEHEALIGALGTIRRCRPLLILEVTLGDELVEGLWFRDNILSLGYAFVDRVHGNHVYACDNGLG